MTRQEALNLLAEYGEYVQENYEDRLLPDSPDERALSDVIGISDRFPDEGSEKKAMRWLGWTQGVLQANGVFTLSAMKAHSKYKTIWMPGERGGIVVRTSW